MNCAKNMEFNDFYKLVSISKEEMIDAKPYLIHRGIKEYINATTFLQGFLTRKPTYNEVTTTFRYDKRIRRILYEYFGFLEENIRAYISNKYDKLSDLPEKCILYLNSHKPEKDLEENDTFVYISYLRFKYLLNLSFLLSDSEIDELFPNLKIKNDTNKFAINEFRNQIGHNKFLLNNRDLHSVSISETFRDSSLRFNIINLINFLPSDVGETLKTKINKASHRGTDKHNGKKRKWELLSNIVVKI